MRKTYLKRATAVTMAAMMLTGNVPIQPVNDVIANMNVEAFASEITGTGTAEDPFVISTVEDWATFAANINAGINADAYYQLSDDFDSTTAVTTTVGTTTNPFKGVFDGNGKTINVAITDTQTQGTAPFRAISDGAVIENLTVEGTVTGTTHAAGLVGFSQSGSAEKPNTIEGCIVNTIVSVPATSGNRHMGGVVGHGTSSYLEIDDTVFGGQMSNSGNYAGGLQGWSDGNHLTINNCLFKGSYSGTGSFHPVAIHNTGSTTVTDVTRCYYTAEPTLTTNGYIAVAGTRVYQEEAFGMQSSVIEAIDGNLYYIYEGIADVWINNADDWNSFANAVNNGNTFEGHTVVLNNDITVSQMVGTSDNKFQGTFLGGGHTLTFNYGTQESPISSENAAPFGYLQNAAIRLLKVEGTIYTSKKYAAGIAAHTYGNCKIQSCISSIDVESSISGDGTHAGFVAVVDEGSLEMTNSLFNGRINGSSTTNCGGFVGWRNANLSLNGCLQNGEMTLSNNSGSATFNRNGQATIDNCYYYTACGDSQGTAVEEMTYEELAEALGSGWAVIDDQVVPVMDLNSLASATVNGVPKYIVLGDNSVVLDYSVIAADGTQLEEGVDYTTVLTCDGEEVEAVDGMGDYQLIITATEDSDYTGSVVTIFTVGDGIAITSGTNELKDGYPYKVDGDVTISSRINISGDVKLILHEGCTLTASNGIEVGAGNKLTIEGSGTLTATGSYNNAGIGAYNTGTIIINGGTINATGGTSGAGIGGSIHDCNGGTIIINGGIVNAKGGSGASGIGGGYDNWAGNYGQCGTITINGGQVTAKAGSSAYGIGTGAGNASNEISGNITLGWTDESDFIYSDGYRAQSIQFADGKQFVTEDGIAEVAKIGGKKLVPLTDNTITNLLYAAITGINSTYEYTDDVIAPEYTVKAADGTELTENEDYTAELTFDGVAVTAVKEPGDYTLTVTGMGDYVGTKVVNFAVVFSAPNGLKQTVVGATGATLVWDAAEVADSYVIEYSRSADFADATTIENITSNTVEINELDTNVVYYARVKAVKGQTSGQWSSTIKFETSDKIWIGFGSEKTSSSLPSHLYYKYSTTQQIYTASEIGQAGVIDSIEYYLTDGNLSRNMEIYMVHTNKTGFENASDWVAVTENDKVFSGTVSFAQDAWTTIEFDKDFVYNGSDNVVIVVDDNTGSYDSSKYFRALEGGNNCSLYTYSDSSNLNPLNNYDNASGYTTNVKNAIRLSATGQYYTVSVDETLSHGVVTPDYESAVKGQVVTLNATPDENYEVVSYIVKDEEGNEIPVTEDDTFVMPKGNVTVSAEFDVLTYFAVSIDSDIANGTVTSDVATANKGTIVSLTVSPDYGYKLVSLMVIDEDENEITVTNNTFKMPRKNVYIMAEFEEVPYYTIEVNEAMTNGTVTADTESVYEGAEVALTVTPAYGYKLASLTVKDEEGNNITVTNNTFVMPGKNVVISAEFYFPVPANFKKTALVPYGAVFVWDALGDAYSYVVEYSTNEAFEESVTIDGITSNTFELTGLTMDTVYFARVKAVAGELESDWSNVISFEVYDEVWPGIGGNEQLSYVPTKVYYEYSLTQQIYTAQEIGQKGLIESIRYFMLSQSDDEDEVSSMNQQTRDLEIYMIQTDRAYFAYDEVGPILRLPAANLVASTQTTLLSDTEEDDFAQYGWFNVTEENKVFDGSVTFVGGEWTTITLDHTFAYDGVSNLVIIVYDKTGDYPEDNCCFLGYEDDMARTLYSYRDDDPYAPSDLSEENEYDCTGCKSQVRIDFKKYQEGWKRDSKGWWYQYADGSYPKNQWKKIREKWYHFDANGYMQTGWYKEGSTYYYLKADGSMACDEWVEDDKYYLDANGKWVQGVSKEGTWKEDANGKWYKNPDGSYPKDQWKKIDENWYRFDENGYVVTGWYKEGNVYYYLKEDGSMAVDEWVENEKYYVDENGHWVKGAVKQGTWKEDANGRWYKNADGSYPKDQWKKIDGNWYRFDENGYVVTGWYKEGNVYYYLKEDGQMAADEWVENEKYYVDENGHWVKGAVKGTVE
ncbi:MAG: fibronectin type III domain-containing protein [Lachnospiraceae bacterium]|nr:fibronectin type III domain-containing protein [Lachnospiraceae bacterium]